MLLLTLDTAPLPSDNMTGPLGRHLCMHSTAWTLGKTGTSDPRSLFLCLSASFPEHPRGTCWLFRCMAS